MRNVRPSDTLARQLANHLFQNPTDTILLVGGTEHGLRKCKLEQFNKWTENVQIGKDTVVPPSTRIAVLLRIADENYTTIIKQLPADAWVVSCNEDSAFYSFAEALHAGVMALTKTSQFTRQEETSLAQASAGVSQAETNQAPAKITATSPMRLIDFIRANLTLEDLKKHGIKLRPGLKAGAREAGIPCDDVVFMRICGRVENELLGKTKTRVRKRGSTSPPPSEPFLPGGPTTASPILPQWQQLDVIENFLQAARLIRSLPEEFFDKLPELIRDSEAIQNAKHKLDKVKEILEEKD